MKFSIPVVELPCTLEGVNRRFTILISFDTTPTNHIFCFIHMNVTITIHKDHLASSRWCPGSNISAYHRIVVGRIKIIVSCFIVIYVGGHQWWRRIRLCAVFICRKHHFPISEEIIECVVCLYFSYFIRIIVKIIFFNGRFWLRHSRLMSDDRTRLRLTRGSRWMFFQLNLTGFSCSFTR